MEKRKKKTVLTCVKITPPPYYNSPKETESGESLSRELDVINPMTPTTCRWKIMIISCVGSMTVSLPRIGTKIWCCDFLPHIPIMLQIRWSGDRLVGLLLTPKIFLFDIIDQVNRLESDNDKKSEEVRHLKEKLTMRESEINWMRDETSQRAQALQTAVRNYAQPLSSAPSVK